MIWYADCRPKPAGVSMDIEAHRQRLLTEERELLARLPAESAEARESTIEPTRDTADESLSSELKEQRFWKAESDRRQLRDVQAALARIDAGTFGLCVVDGKPIEARRLEATPWTPYCLEHQRQRERDRGARPPSTL
jgi:DnaK suppressor protein